MSLDNYLRSVVEQNMLKFLNVCCCEKCGSTHNLHIHHDEMFFFEMVDKTLNDLGLPHYQDKDKYTESEIEKISIYILGLHLKSKYRVLCEECHTNLHKECVKRRHKKIDDIDKDVVLQFLVQLEGKFIYSDSKEVLGQLLNTRYVGIKSINNILNELFGEEYALRLHSKDIEGKRYVDTRRKIQDGTPNPNRDKTYWMLW